MYKAKDNILAVWQPTGVSTNRLSQIVGERYGTLSSHTGTLDPMAEGVVIILLGDTRLKKYEYAHWRKIYEFEIIFGISTDSFDAMGLITGKNKLAPPKIEIEKILHGFVGSYSQNVPMYSAVKLKGKKLFERARAKEILENTPVKKGEIFKLCLKRYSEVSLNSCIKDILKRINSVKGDFRQEPIVSQWEKLAGTEKKVVKAKFEVEMSKGLYVRSLSQGICKKLGCLGFTYSIKRTKNGIYGREEAVAVEKLFSSRRNFDNLVSGVKS
ncbi:hypothetical protein A3K01_00650 [candidate division WWE3 bacterium RIFOXYD1_FULL_43_17]|uniref:tRNA pseudouridine(55) synthase n=3 Tax=Katanobacteria TaxID=422282 RepID=A0A1F4XES1_UNCKA|nr:MAG: tRNA pseudouridine synthase B [candidate division WWE3 bacterium GW2011_GWE1_41_27]KKS59819.1 MAG: tRNA pseudouridine synthase B [candidate division WWE3 bacterium GW2011_GWF2_42_42]OGC80124.1 MAG: hypothetical protein A3K01_00650 [candidate division WWE3 bacterium RIFOXYD1_FULL_43_17]